MLTSIFQMGWNHQLVMFIWDCTFTTCQFLHANANMFYVVNKCVYIHTYICRCVILARVRRIWENNTKAKRDTHTQGNIFWLGGSKFLIIWYACVTPSYTPSLTWNLKMIVSKFGISEIPGADFQVNHMKLPGCTIPSTKLNDKIPWTPPELSSLRSHLPVHETSQ